MKFQTFDEAQSTVKALNKELVLIAHFGEMQMPCIMSVRSIIRRGQWTHSLSDYLTTAACMVPRVSKITHLPVKSVAGETALSVLRHNYPKLSERKKTADDSNRSAVNARLDDFLKRMYPHVN